MPSSRAPRGEGERTWFFFLCLALLNIVDSFNLNVVWPMLPFMVEEYGVARDPKDLGAWVGVAGAAVSVGQLIGSYAWGASPTGSAAAVMLLGMFNSTFSVLIFGTAKMYAQCVAGRFLSGLLNGNAGVVKTYVGETTEKTQQAAAFSVFAIASKRRVRRRPGRRRISPATRRAMAGNIRRRTLRRVPVPPPHALRRDAHRRGGILGLLYVPRLHRRRGACERGDDTTKRQTTNETLPETWRRSYAWRMVRRPVGCARRWRCRGRKRRGGAGPGRDRRRTRPPTNRAKTMTRRTFVS